MLDMIVRRATTDDALEIREIALSRRVSSDSGEKTGLIDYPVPDLQKYELRISRGLFYVAHDYKENKILGFTDAYLGETLESMFPNDPIIAEIKYLEKKPFAYINTMAVRKDAESRGLSHDLFRMARQGIPHRYESIWSAIVHAPLKNVVSSSIADKLGFKMEKEVQAYDNITFGLYRLDLKRK